MIHKGGGGSQRITGFQKAKPKLYLTLNNDKAVIRLNAEKHLYLTFKIISAYLLCLSCRLHYPFKLN
jgi:hypothetical protein